VVFLNVFFLKDTLKTFITGRLRPAVLKKGLLRAPVQPSVTTACSCIRPSVLADVVPGDPQPVLHDLGGVDDVGAAGTRARGRTRPRPALASRSTGLPLAWIRMFLPRRLPLSYHPVVRRQRHDALRPSLELTVALPTGRRRPCPRRSRSASR
jgi:hypothetical protein